MTEIYTVILGKNNEVKEIIDHSKQDKHMSLGEFLKQVIEQDRLLKELKNENKELKHFKQLVFDLIDRKINEMENMYKFGQEVYKGCPMHNIRYGINILKELRKELFE